MAHRRAASWLPAMLALGISCAIAQEPETAETPSQTEGEQAVEEVVVTGSRIKRRDFSSPSPLATVDRTDFEFSGQPTLEDYLSQMPQLMPGFGRAVNNGGDGTATLNLRGMGAGRTLVLLNGRRLSPSGVGSAVDVNNLPGVLIERVEIITGGASTVYGSDAIAGVVNFITRDDFDGLSFEGSYSVSEQGDADVYDVNVVYGHNLAGGGGNITAYAGYYERKELFASARELTRYVWSDDWVSGALQMGGSPIIPGGRIAQTDVTWDPDGTPRAFVEPDDRYNFQPENYLQTPLERHTTGLMGTFAVGERLEGYFEASYAENDARLTLAPAPAAAFVVVNTDNPVLTPETRQLLEEQYLIEPGLAQITLQRRMLELGPRIIEPNRDYTRLVAGIRGKLGQEWELDAWLTWTDADTTEQYLNDGSLSRLQQGLLVDPATGQCFDPSGGCVPLDVFGEGRLSPEGVAFIRVDEVVNTSSRQQYLASVLATGPAFDIWSGPVNMAIGAEWRRDEGSFQADDLLFSGDTMSFNGTAPVDGTEQVYELYTEALVPLFENPDTGRRLGLELGARYSNYDHAGSVWTWKAGLNWQVFDALRFRTMFQRAVRAPNIEELFREQSTQVHTVIDRIITDPCSASSDPVGSGNADKCVLQGLPENQLGVFEASLGYPVADTRGGNPALEPESSDTFTMGLVINPVRLPKLTIAVDYYDLEITNTIGEIDALRICFDPLNTGAVFCDNLTRDATGNIAAIYQPISNRGLLATNGLDVQVEYAADLPASWALFDGYAQLHISFLETHAFSNESQANVATEVVDCNGFFGYPCWAVHAGAESGTSFPENRALTTINYTSGPLDLHLTWQWIDSMDNAGNLISTNFNFAVPTVPSYNDFDLALSYLLTDTLKLRFGINNLTDQDAPMMADNALANNTDARLYDVFGRSYFLSLTWNPGG